MSNYSLAIRPKGGLYFTPPSSLTLVAHSLLLSRTPLSDDRGGAICAREISGKTNQCRENRPHPYLLFIFSDFLDNLGRIHDASAVVVKNILLLLILLPIVVSALLGPTIDTTPPPQTHTHTHTHTHTLPSLPCIQCSIETPLNLLPTSPTPPPSIPWPQIQQPTN